MMAIKGKTPFLKSAVLSIITIIGPIILAVTIIGCARERPSSQSPIHLNPNMDSQEKYKPQSQSRFFADRSAMRSPVPGTVARTELRDDDEYYLGKDGDGKFISRLPIETNMVLLKHGRERFDIYCSPCHSRIGDGRGIMIKRGYVPPPSFHTERIRDLPDGHIYDVISNGIRNMPAYAHQIPVEDRWAIVAYLRALQRSQNATVEDIPDELRNKIRQGRQ
jgi:hypothetical protein